MAVRARAGDRAGGALAKRGAGDRDRRDRIARVAANAPAVRQHRHCDLEPGSAGADRRRGAGDRPRPPPPAAVARVQRGARARLPAWRWRCCWGRRCWPARSRCTPTPWRRSFVYGRGQPFVGDQITPGALDYLRSHAAGRCRWCWRRLPPLPSNWFSGIAFELVGGAPGVRRRQSRATTASPSASISRGSGAETSPRSSIPPPRAAERQAILDRWHVTDVAVDLKRASPQLVRAAGRRPEPAPRLHRPTPVRPKLRPARNLGS